jgi:hypothetical protein
LPEEFPVRALGDPFIIQAPAWPGVEGGGTNWLTSLCFFTTIL